ncbi:MAG: WecB/TagA/CpsF family glycosyltransferase [Kiritimatiellae bacterium]|nr:WecB/TagA/CpsF family glycosyltransferase [Kiritimatiellia bacterium]
MNGISRLFGIPLAKVTQAEAVEKVIALAKTRRRPAHFVATLNVDFVCNAVPAWPFKGNKELWLYLRRADFVVADGMPIVWLSRLMGDPLPERVTGSDGVPLICKRCAEEGLSIYVLGGDPVVLNEAFSILREASPALRIAGMNTSEVRLEEDQGVLVNHINAARPDILFVALGNPKEELWMGRHVGQLDVGVTMGVGGSFNFLAGLVPRAPEWMQRSGLEWAYRVYQEPKRLWRRYVYGLFKFSWLAVRSLCGCYRE